MFSNHGFLFPTWWLFRRPVSKLSQTFAMCAQTPSEHYLVFLNTWKWQLSTMRHTHILNKQVPEPPTNHGHALGMPWLLQAPLTRQPCELRNLLDVPWLEADRIKGKGDSNDVEAPGGRPSLDKRIKITNSPDQSSIIALTYHYNAYMIKIWSNTFTIIQNKQPQMKM